MCTFIFCTIYDVKHNVDNGINYNMRFKILHKKCITCIYIYIHMQHIVCSVQHTMSEFRPAEFGLFTAFAL